MWSWTFGPCSTFSKTEAKRRCPFQQLNWHLKPSFSKLLSCVSSFTEMFWPISASDKDLDLPSPPWQHRKPTIISNVLSEWWNQTVESTPVKMHLGECLCLCVCVWEVWEAPRAISASAHNKWMQRAFQGGGRGRKFEGPYKEKESCDTSIDNKSETKQNDSNSGWHPDHKSIQQSPHPPYK